MVDQVLGIALRKSVRRTKNHDGYFEDACTGILRKSKEIIVLDVGGTKYYVLKSKPNIIFSTLLFFGNPLHGR